MQPLLHYPAGAGLAGHGDLDVQLELLGRVAGQRKDRGGEARVIAGDPGRLVGALPAMLDQDLVEVVARPAQDAHFDRLDDQASVRGVIARVEVPSNQEVAAGSQGVPPFSGVGAELGGELHEHMVTHRGRTVLVACGQLGCRIPAMRVW